MNIAIYIYDNAEVLDFSGPFEVFSTANRLTDSSQAFNVFLVAEEQRAINARGGYSVNPHFDFSNHPAIDVLIIVGGVHTNQLKNISLIEWIKNNFSKASIVASVCTGAFILAEAELLNGLTVTTHWEDISDLRSSYPALTVVDGVRWVDQGKFVTSGGISAGIDMSLHLVSRLRSVQLAEKTARQMEFDWQQNN